MAAALPTSASPTRMDVMDVFGFDEEHQVVGTAHTDDHRQINDFDYVDDDDDDLPFWVQQAAFSPPAFERSSFFLPPTPSRDLQPKSLQPSPLRSYAGLSGSPPSPAKPIRDTMRLSADPNSATADLGYLDEGQYSNSAPQKSYVLVETDSVEQKELRDQQEALRRLQQQRRMQLRDSAASSSYSISSSDLR